MERRFGKTVMERNIVREPTLILSLLPSHLHFPKPISAESQSQRTLVMWLVGFLIQLQAKHYVPDSTLNLLLKFLYTFFCVLGRISEFVAAMVTYFPSTIYRLKKTLPFAHPFTLFVVCPKC